MIKLLFSVYDSKADVYWPLTGSFTIPEAIREFSQMVNSNSSPERPNTLNSNSEDYSLFHVARFNQLTGEVVPVPITQVITALSCKESSRDAMHKLDLAHKGLSS